MNRNEAIEIVRKHYPDDRCLLFNEALETLVPELKESENEDERIRGKLIDLLDNIANGRPGTMPSATHCMEWIAWLEKRDEQNTAPFKAEHGKYYYCIKDYFCGGKKWASKGDVIQALRGLPIMGLDDASEFFLPVNDIQLNNNINHNDRPKFKVGDWIVYDKYGTKDIDRIVKFDHDIVRFESSTWLLNYQLNKDCKLWTIKDAEGGDVLSCENGWTCIFKALDNHTNTFSSYCFMDKKGWFCECGGQGHTLDDRICGEIHPATKEQRDLLFQKMKEAGYEWDAEKKELKNVEPKFKVGDWVVTEDGKVNQVKKVSDDGDAYTLDDGTYFSGSWKDMYHLWTIQDAKDGDVLANKYGSVFIYAGFEDDKRVTVDDYCYITANHHEFCIEDHKTGSWYYVRDLNPATIEQRCLLFQKMSEAGYEWDNENKILTKIELVPTPKYQEGDWLICDDFTPIRVDCVDSKEQKYYLSNGDIRPSEMLDNNPYIRLWSIHDAKYGDVLYNYEGSTGVEAIHLVKGWEDVDGTGRTLCSIATYRVLDNEVIKGGLGAIWWEGNPLEFRPATEEEKKKLLEKMTFFKKKQKTWKPTREQLRQLDAVIDAYAKGSKTHTELRSLSEDLKKLK